MFRIRQRHLQQTQTDKNNISTKEAKQSTYYNNNFLTRKDGIITLIENCLHLTSSSEILRQTNGWRWNIAIDVEVADLQRKFSGAPLPPHDELRIFPISWFLVNFCYRPQRSYEGYVFTGVCLSTGGVWYPSMPCSRSPDGGCAIPACIAGGIPAYLATGLEGGMPGPWGGLLPGDLLHGGVCLDWGVSAPGGLLPGGLLGGGAGIPACTEADPLPPGETATAADSTHPNGMHSC